MVSHDDRRAEELLVERLAAGGEGVARLGDGRVAFIGGTCPGDLVRAVITEDRGSYVRATAEEVLQASPDRVRPTCPRDDQCGGCQWRHIAYDRQLAAKHSQVADSLERVGKLDRSVVEAAVASPVVDGYRNKAEFAVDLSAGRVRLGYTRQGGFVPVERCLLLPGKHAGAPRAVAGALNYLSKGRDIGISRVALRASTRTGEVEVSLWGPPGAFPRAPAAKVLADAVGATSVVRVLVKGDTRGRRVSKVEVLGGKGHWTERLAEFSFTVSAPSFFQVNTDAAELLVRRVVDAVPSPVRARVFDVYAGVGTFTLPFAALGAGVTAFEAEGSAVRDLRRNADRARLPVEVVPGDAARSMRAAGEADAAVVDPPRAGLSGPALEALVASRASRIVYVSCDPATLARDLATLAARGYRPASVTPIDLFPQTHHVEAVAVLDA
ncbi:MAG: 23S rRNA (uracil(1939)-C(5))-methyltransferase RlmD [Coriobacteriia bacterium]|nr:23S rRNA (uracil(1939)-C(5))-methyltransferase RlmD [Coriobacteriia bacterium]